MAFPSKSMKMEKLKFQNLFENNPSFPKAYPNNREYKSPAGICLHQKNTVHAE